MNGWLCTWTIKSIIKDLYSQICDLDHLQIQYNTLQCKKNTSASVLLVMVTQVLHSHYKDQGYKIWV